MQWVFFTSDWHFCWQVVYDEINIECGGLGLTNDNLDQLGFNRLSHFTIYGLNMSSNSFTELPDNIFRYLNNSQLQHLDLSFNNLRDPPKALSQLPSLYGLTLEGNNIDLAGGTSFFTSLTNLEKLDMSQNSVRTLRDGVFTGLGSLTSLHIDNNIITTINDGTFKSTAFLELLNLNKNKLKVLNSGMFQGLQLIQEIHLSSNQITDIASNTFQAMWTLRGIYLDSNHISTLDKAVFVNVTNLKILSLSNNHLHQMSPGSFQGTRLHDLDLMSNFLSVTSSDFLLGAKGSLQVLSLGFNMWDTFDDDFFTGMKNLALLHLDGLSITKLPNLRDIGNLYALSISYTGISTIYECELVNLPIEYLVWTHSPIQCDCNLRWLTKRLTGIRDSIDKLDIGDLINKDESVLDTEDIAFYEDIVDLVVQPWTCKTPERLSGENMEKLSAANLDCPLGQQEPFWCEPYNLTLPEGHYFVFHVSNISDGQVSLQWVLSTGIQSGYQTTLTLDMVDQAVEGRQVGKYLKVIALPEGTSNYILTNLISSTRYSVCAEMRARHGGLLVRECKLFSTMARGLTGNSDRQINPANKAAVVVIPIALGLGIMVFVVLLLVLWRRVKQTHRHGRTIPGQSTGFSGITNATYEREENTGDSSASSSSLSSPVITMSQLQLREDSSL